MPKFLTRGLFAALLLVLSLFAVSSALGAARSHSERTRAEAHRAGVGAGRRVSQAHKAAHQGRRKRKASPVPPVKTPAPIKPVSPVEPTPPITPVAPVETTPPPVIPAPPVETTPPTPPTPPTAPVEPVTPIAPVESPPTPPTASFTYLPTSPAAGQAVTLDGAGSTCPDDPCTYAWSDDGGPTRPIPALWPLGGGQNLSFTFTEAGMKYVRLVVTDAAGQTASVEHNVVVAEPAKEEKAKEEKAKEEKAQEEKAREEKAAEEKAKEEKTVTPTGCFENPETEGTTRFEACGYPGPKNTGVAETSGKTECSALPEYTGSKSISTEGTTIEGKEIRYTLPAYLSITASNVTLKNDCFMLKGEASSEAAIILGSNAKNVTIEHTTIRGENSTTQSFEVAIKSFSGPKVIVKDDRLEDCAECIQGSAEISGSYLLANRELGNTGLHRETVYMNTGSGNGEVPEETLIARNSTFLVPEASVAIVFANTGNGVYTDPCGSHITLEGNLLAGSGQMVQQCGSRSEKGPATLALEDNRVARCLTTPIKNNASGMPNCSGSYFEGGDSHGYFPYGGSLSVQDDRTNGPTGAAYVWEGNVWDDNLAAIAAPAP
jgi:outer membrane biosynthesis protein TonB